MRGPLTLRGNDVAIMSQTQIFVSVLGAILLLVTIVYLLRHRLTELNLDFFRGLIKFGGRASPAVPPNSTPGGEAGEIPFEQQYMSHAVLGALQTKLNKTRGHHVVLETTTENFHAASTLYGQLHGNIIATCFFESPDYGDHDLAEAILAVSRFSRITIRSMCDEDAQTKVAARFATYRSRARLIVLDESTQVSKIGGIFCRCDDGSHLAFMALNNFCDAKPKNLGLVFCGDLAEQMYRYYKSFVDRYS